MSRPGTSPTQLSIRRLKDLGMACAVVEKFNTFVGEHGIRQDMFGFADIVAVGRAGIMAVQTTSRGNISSRERKVLMNPAAYLWALGNGIVVVHGWEMNGAGRWECEERRLSVADFNAARDRGITPEYKLKRRRQRVEKAGPNLFVRSA